MTPSERAAADQLATAARTHMASYLAAAHRITADTNSREEALAGLTLILMRQDPAGVAGIAAAALLALAEKEGE